MEEKTLSVKDIFDAIGQLRSETAYLNNALSTLSDIPCSGSGNCGAPGDIGSQAKAQAIADVVKCRETTNQQMLAFYQRLYDDIVNAESKAFATQADVIQKSFQDVSACISNAELNSEDRYAALCEVIDRISGLLADLIKKKPVSE